MRRGAGGQGQDRLPQGQDRGERSAIARQRLQHQQAQAPRDPRRPPLPCVGTVDRPGHVQAQALEPVLLMRRQARRAGHADHLGMHLTGPVEGTPQPVQALGVHQLAPRHRLALVGHAQAEDPQGAQPLPLGRLLQGQLLLLVQTHLPLARGHPQVEGAQAQALDLERGAGCRPAGLQLQHPRQGAFDLGVQQVRAGEDQLRQQLELQGQSLLVEACPQPAGGPCVRPGAGSCRGGLAAKPVPSRPALCGQGPLKHRLQGRLQVLDALAQRLLATAVDCRRREQVLESVVPGGCSERGGRRGSPGLGRVIVAGVTATAFVTGELAGGRLQLLGQGRPGRLDPPQGRAPLGVVSVRRGGCGAGPTRSRQERRAQGRCHFHGRGLQAPRRLSWRGRRQCQVVGGQGASRRREAARRAQGGEHP